MHGQHLQYLMVVQHEMVHAKSCDVSANVQLL